MAAGVAVVDEFDASDQLTNEEIVLPLTQHGLSANYDGATALTKQQSPQDHFSARYEQTPDWRSRGSIPHRSGRRHDPHARRRARHSVVSGRGSPGSSIQAGSS